MFDFKEVGSFKAAHIFLIRFETKLKLNFVIF